MSDDFILDTRGVIKPVRWEDEYTMVANAFAQDRSLSHFTTAFILDTVSRSKGWQVSVPGMMAVFGVGRDKAREALREAQEAGYLHAHTERDEKGRITGCTYYIASSKAALAREG